MKVNVQDGSKGYTIVELMVTIVIVSVLTGVVGMFFVKLLNIQERDREEAYVREKLADICGSYADMLSVGSSFGTSNLVMRVKYRWETGGGVAGNGCRHPRYATDLPGQQHEQNGGCQRGNV